MKLAPGLPEAYPERYAFFCGVLSMERGSEVMHCTTEPLTATRQKASKKPPTSGGV